MFKIITWNVNSIRTRLSHVLSILKKETPDVILLQEIKCEDKNFPFCEIEEEGYTCVSFGQKSYNGVAILSKEPIEDVRRGVIAEDARYIEGITYFKGNVIKIASVYVPNGGSSEQDKRNNLHITKTRSFEYKMKFLDKLYDLLEAELKFGEVFIIGGDINIAPSELDVYSENSVKGTICCSQEERRKFKAFLNLGYGDAIRILAENKKIFSWYDYRKGALVHGKGLRIDHFLTSPLATDKICGYKILEEFRTLERPSDHVPIQITFNI